MVACGNIHVRVRGIRKRNKSSVQVPGFQVSWTQSFSVSWYLPVSRFLFRNLRACGFLGVWHRGGINGLFKFLGVWVSRSFGFYSGSLGFYFFIWISRPPDLYLSFDMISVLGELWPYFFGTEAGRVNNSLISRFAREIKE